MVNGISLDYIVQDYTFYFTARIVEIIYTNILLLIYVNSLYLSVEIIDCFKTPSEQFLSYIMMKGPLWLWSYDSWIYIYLWNQYLSTL